jgi:lipoate-protein ligase B
VSLHGFSINANVDLRWFSTIRPCGLAPETFTSLEALLGRTVEIGDLTEAVTFHFGAVLGYSQVVQFKTPEQSATDLGALTS